MPELTLPDIERALEVCGSLRDYVAESRDPITGWEACLLELKRRMTPVTVISQVGEVEPIRSIGTMHTCPACDTVPVYRGNRFCPNCGTPLNWEGR